MDIDLLRRLTAKIFEAGSFVSGMFELVVEEKVYSTTTFKNTVTEVVKCRFSAIQVQPKDSILSMMSKVMADNSAVRNTTQFYPNPDTLVDSEGLPMTLHQFISICKIGQRVRTGTTSYIIKEVTVLPNFQSPIAVRFGVTSS
jgi:hypothetical protein